MKDFNFGINGVLNYIMDKEIPVERELLNSPMAKRDRRLYDYLSILYDNAEKLKKQRFYKPKPIFYHLSRRIFSTLKIHTIYGTEELIKEKMDLDKVKNKRATLVFLSPELDCCIDFFTRQNAGKHYAFLYKFLLTENLHLFNAFSENDLLKLEKTLDKNEFEIFKQSTSNHGNDMFWFFIKQDHILNAIHKIGYDGLCSFCNEKDIVENDFHHAGKIVLLNPSGIRIVSREKVDIRNLSNRK